MLPVNILYDVDLLLFNEYELNDTPLSTNAACPTFTLVTRP